MNIAIVHEWITNVAGSERVLLVLKEIFPEAVIYTSVYDPSNAKAFHGHDIRTTYLQNLPLLKKKRELLIPLTPMAFEQLDLSEYDLVISNSTFASKGVITKPETIHISYCHTPPRYLWDPQVDPRAKTGRFSGLRNKVMHEMRLWDRVAADRVDYFFANSKYVANRVKKFYRRDARVMYPPVDVTNFQIDSTVERGDHYLFVSRLINYKKCDLVIQAFNENGLPLRVVGFGPDQNKLIAMAKDNITFVGPKSNKDLVLEYQRAKGFVFPAEEDFGIVPIEAMACGTPVIAFGKGGATETVVSGKTGLFFQKQSFESLNEAIEEFESMKFDREQIRAQAMKFSTEIFKKKFQEEVDKIIELKNSDNKKGDK